MTDQEKIAFVQATWRSVLSMDAAAALPNIAPDLRWTIEGRFPGVQRENIGHAAVLQLMEEGRRLFPSGIETEFRHAHCTGDTVILEYTNRGPVFNGKVYENDYCLVYELRDGKIAAVREYFDTQTTLNLLYAE